MAPAATQARNQEQDIAECNTSALNCKEACYCSTKVALKYYTTIAAGVS